MSICMCSYLDGFCEFGRGVFACKSMQTRKSPFQDAMVLR